MQFIQLHDGLIHYKHLCTQHNAPTLVFINALGTDLRIWENVLPRLTEYNVLVFDKPGHGLSDYQPQLNTLEEHALLVTELCRALHITYFTPVGLSVGGMIAQILAATNPMVKSAVFCCTSYKAGTPAMWAQRIAAVRAEGLSAITGGIMEKWFSQKYRAEQPATVTGVKKLVEQTTQEGYIALCEALSKADLKEQSKTITVPTLAVSGGADQSIPTEQVQAMQELIPGCRFMELKNSGHMPCVDNATELASLISGFIQ